MHTLLIIGIFTAIVLAPVAAAFISARYGRRNNQSSDQVPRARVPAPLDPSAHYLAPRPRNKRPRW